MYSWVCNKRAVCNSSACVVEKRIKDDKYVVSNKHVDGYFFETKLFVRLKNTEYEKF